MKKKLRTVSILLLAAIVIICLGYTLLKLRDYRTGEQEYANAEQLAQLPEEPEFVPEVGDPYAIALAETDLAALREVNSDVIGWISIPNTDVSYPLLQTNDNNYYLKRTWNLTASSVGSIFLECQNAPDFSDFNTIIYGHNMRNGSMFGGLKQYKNSSYWEEHPSVYIVDDSGVHRYDIFAASEVGVRTIIYGLQITTRALKQDFIDFSLKHSVLDTGIVPTYEDRVLTLSTCTGNGYSTRWVVQAVLAETTPLSAKD